MASTKDTSRAHPVTDDDVARLKKEVDERTVILGRATARIQKLETELETSRAQVAWLHRQLFGQKAELVAVA
ncbi:MAG: hypothetical protein IT384_03580 [Deltaproteobacteria bacterium]|nr:hypothetical protein [Deltaproteobacteria bacterium]